VKPVSAAATSGGAVRDPAIESEVEQTPEPAAYATVAPIAASRAKSVAVRHRTPNAARRTGVEAPLESPAANSAPMPTATRRSRTAGVARSTGLVQFVVTYLTEQTLQAASALDAMQQAQARGATEVTSIVRIA
jgi:hypothetical protein